MAAMLQKKVPHETARNRIHPTAEMKNLARIFSLEKLVTKAHPAEIEFVAESCDFERKDLSFKSWVAVNFLNVCSAQNLSRKKKGNLLSVRAKPGFARMTAFAQKDNISGWRVGMYKINVSQN